MSTMDKKTSFNPEGSGKYPFRVSDAYLDHLTARIMEQIPDENASEATPQESTKMVDINKNRHRNQWWLRTISIAASFALVAVVALKLIPTAIQPPTPNQTDGLKAEYTSDDYNEDLMTYTMADNMDVYCYLSGTME